MTAGKATRRRRPLRGEAEPWPQPPVPRQSAHCPPPAIPRPQGTPPTTADKSRRCQQGSRTVSATPAGLRARLACTAWRAAIPLPAALRGSGLDLSASMFAPCLLGRPGTGRQDAVLASLRLAGLRYSSACRSIPVAQVFKKVPLSSGLLIRGFGVQVPGGAPVLT